DVYGSGNGGYAEVSIDGRSLGTKCLNSAAIGAAKQTVDFDSAILLTQGEHTLSIKNSVYTGKSKAGNGFFSFTFTPGAALGSVSLTYDKEFILLNDPNGEKLTLSAKYLNLEDVELDVIMEDAKVSYKSSDENIATVTADGVVMPEAEGKVTITASVTIENVTKEASVEVIIEDLEYESAVFTTEQTVFYIGSENEIFATAVLSDGTLLEQSEVVCTFTSDNTAAAVFEGNVLKALTDGIANITANVTFNGETKSVTMEIEVVPVTSFILDFDKVTSDLGKLTPASGGYTTHAIKAGNEFYGENWKMLTDAENSKIFANEPDAALKLAFYGAKYINITKTKEELEAGNDTLSFEFTSPISGTFNVSGEMYFGQSGGIAELFIDGKSVGSFDSNKEANSGAVTRQPVNFGKSISITEGTHRLTIKSSVHTGAATVANGFYTVKFNPAGELDSVTLSHNKDYILLSDKNGKKLTLSAKHVTGTELNLESDGVDISFSSSDDKIATVDENGVVKPVSAGNVTITAEVTVGEVTKSDKLTLKINDSAYDKAEIDVVRELFFEGGTTEISATGILSDGTRLEPEDVTVRFESDNTAVATVEGNILSTIKEGTANITAYVTFNDIEKSVTKEIKVVPVDIARIEAKTEDAIISLLDADGSKLVVTGINNDGSIADIAGTEFTYKVLTPELVTVDESGNVRAIGRGPAKVEVTANIGGAEFKCVANVVASSEKTEPTLFTYEMRENALENIAKNDWAMDMKKAAVKEAEYWLENYEEVYDSIMYEGIPRTHSIGLHDGPEDFDYKCAYCNEDIRDYTTPYAWGHDPLNRPWKVQCHACKRLFP
ncbi:MAG: Ig-like domain-containing protein, partial [Oscillospiraceae bacterium]|nr:Ig-like domain-containing protein [Oscillospiraceae bacterium]